MRLTYLQNCKLHSTEGTGSESHLLRKDKSTGTYGQALAPAKNVILERPKLSVNPHPHGTQTKATHVFEKMPGILTLSFVASNTAFPMSSCTSGPQIALDRLAATRPT
jgi:hypothetical protein